MRLKLYFPVIFVCLAMITATLSFSSCHLTDQLTSQTNTPINEEEKIISMSKGPCFGKCPVFTLSIYKNAMAAYQGDRFTERKGLWVKRLEKTEFNKLKEAFQKANLWQYNDMYKAQIPDLQTVTITYTENGKTKSVKGKDGRPGSGHSARRNAGRNCQFGGMGTERSTGVGFAGRRNPQSVDCTAQPGH